MSSPQEPSAPFNVNLSILHARTQKKRNFCLPRKSWVCSKKNYPEAGVQLHQGLLLETAGRGMQPHWFAATLAALMSGQDLAEAAMRQLMQDVMQGRCGDAEMAALLV